MLARARKISRQITREAVAVIRVFRQAAFDNPANGRGNGGVQLGNRRWLLADDRRQRFGHGRTVKGALGGEHLVEDGAERELIGSCVGARAARLLGRHIANCAQHHTRRSPDAGVCFGCELILRRIRDPLGKAEVEDLGEPVDRDADVLRFQIAVDEAGLVSFCQSFGDLAGDLERAAQRDGAKLQKLPQRLAGDQLHADKRLRPDLSGVVDRHDGRMIECGSCARFFLEAAEALGIAGELDREQFQGDDPIKVRIVGAVDLAHRTGADETGDFVRAESHTLWHARTR